MYNTLQEIQRKSHLLKHYQNLSWISLNNFSTFSKCDARSTLFRQCSTDRDSNETEKEGVPALLSPECHKAIKTGNREKSDLGTFVP